MLRDGRRVHQSTIPYSVLPDRPPWLFLPNSIKLNPFEAAFGSYKLRPALVVYATAETVAVCPIVAWPENSDLLPPCEANEDAEEPWICSPNWTERKDAVDLSQSIDSSVLATRYLDTVFGAPMELFAKSVLSRVRSELENTPEQLEFKLKELVLSPEALDTRFRVLSTMPPDLAKRVEEWREQRKKPVAEALKELLKRETQVQVVLLLELEALTEKYVSLLTAHFQRLCIWQAIDGSDNDEVLQFCSQVVIPFYRSRLPDRTRQLAKASRGVVYAHQRPRLKRRAVRPTRIASGQVAAQLAFQKAFQSSNTASGEKEPAANTKQTSTLAKRSISRSMLAHEKRQVQVSFGKAPPASSTPPPLPSKAMSTTVTKTASVSQNSQIHVEGTPQTKSRTVLLPKEAIPLDFGGAIDSTDDDDDL